MKNRAHRQSRPGWIALLRLSWTYVILRHIFWVVDPPGNPFARVQFDGKTIQSTKALRNEMRSQLPDWVYEKFGRAVRYQKHGRYRKALHEYRHLRKLPGPNNTRIDLYAYSKVFKNNWNMLIEVLR
jgi:hypothetical protein